MGTPADPGTRLKLGMRSAYDAAGARYARYIAPVFRPIAMRVVELAAPAPGERHVDLATGSGGLLRAASKRAAQASLLGIDLSPEMLGLARTAAPNARLIQADLERLPLGTATTDVATLAFALHHLPDPHAALREIDRILRPGGRIAVAAWDDKRGPLSQLFDDWFERVGLPSAGPNQQADRPIDTLDRLRQGLAEAGFSDIDAESQSTPFRFSDLTAYWDWRVSFPAIHRALTSRDESELARLCEQFTSLAAAQIGSGPVADDRQVLYALARKR